MSTEQVASGPDISVVIPMPNEEDSLKELHQGLRAVLDALPQSAEVVFVDDGSDDGSFALLQELHATDATLRIIKLRRHFGKSTALMTGFEAARGKVVLTMDGDLQDVPDEIPKLLAKLEEGFDLVSGWRKQRQDPFVKVASSRLFNVVTSLLTGVRLHDINAGLKAYRAPVIREIHLYGEMHRFIPVLAQYKGFRVGEVATLHCARKAGKSKYGPSKLLAGFFDLLTLLLLTRYEGKPLHMFGITGLTLAAVGFVISLYLTIRWFLGEWIGNRPLLILGVLLLVVGVQFVFFGLLAEIIIYLSAREPRNVVEREVG